MILIPSRDPWGLSGGSNKTEGSGEGGGKRTLGGPLSLKSDFLVSIELSAGFSRARRGRLPLGREKRRWAKKKKGQKRGEGGSIEVQGAPTYAWTRGEN